MNEEMQAVPMKMTQEEVTAYWAAYYEAQRREEAELAAQPGSSLQAAAALAMGER